MDKYAQDRYLSYSGQVIGIKKGGEGRPDSAQGLENIRQLIRSAQQLQYDTLRQQNIRPWNTVPKRNKISAPTT